MLVHYEQPFLHRPEHYTTAPYGRTANDKLPRPKTLKTAQKTEEPLLPKPLIAAFYSSSDIQTARNQRCHGHTLRAGNAYMELDRRHGANELRILMTEHKELDIKYHSPAT